MNLTARILSVIQKLRKDDGQDLVEYALLIALVAFASVSGMGKLAHDINSVFVALGTQLPG